jgi:formylglycine-generating enzyme required for sulfatase activity
VNTQIGTPGFMAPEQLLADRVVDGRCDQYALAATMYVALTGKPLTYETTRGSPVKSPGQPGTRRKALRPVNAPDLAPHVPPAAAAAIAKGLKPEPEDRFLTCEALAEAFEAGLRLPQTGARTVVKRREEVTRSARSTALQAPAATARGATGRRRLAVTLVLLAALGACAFVLLRKQPGQEEPTGSPTPALAKAPKESPAPTKASWEIPLAEALAAMEKDDGDGAKAALARAEAADVPAPKVKVLQGYVAAWDQEPALTIVSPARGAEIEAGADGNWHIEVAGNLTTGRKDDRVLVEGKEVRTGTGDFSAQVERTTGGADAVTVDVRSGSTTRKQVVRGVTLKALAPKDTLPAWAVPLLSQAQKDEAQRLKVAAAFDEPTTGMRFVLIPGGTFMMGSPDPKSNGFPGLSTLPQHRVTVPPFYMSIHETTVEQFRQMDGYPRAESLAGTRPWTTGAIEAEEFAAWLSLEDPSASVYSIPTEAQWEYAARAGTTTHWSFGDDEAQLGQYGWFKDNAGGETHPVGQKKPNPWGLFDMHGNVDEWCADDKHPTYAGAPTDGTAWIDSPRGEARVTRGGDCYSQPDFLGSEYRLSSATGGGFRLARTVSGSRTPLEGGGPTQTPSTAQTLPVPAWASAIVSKEQIQEAKRLDVAVAFENDLGMRFVLVPAGTFPMGSPVTEEERTDDEGPQHAVTVSSFYLQIAETTNAQFRAFRSSRYSGGADQSRDEQPIEVGFGEAAAFMHWLRSHKVQLGARLPTEAEWEYACRGGTQTRFAFGDADPSNEQANFYGGPGKTTSAGTYKPNAWGLFDMHGNVEEWCSDWYGVYTTTAQRDPRGPATGKHRVIRNAGYGSGADRIRSAFRWYSEPGVNAHRAGVRAAVSVK